MTLTHLDETGAARMVDTSAKPTTLREAVAAGEVWMLPETRELIQGGDMPKGDVLAVARVAGIMAAKRTSELIPLCHPLPITAVEMRFVFLPDKPVLQIVAQVRCAGTTGVEMEALTAVSVAALAVYDMCKSVDRAMRIQNVRLVRKHGGKSGDIVLEDLE